MKEKAIITGSLAALILVNPLQAEPVKDKIENELIPRSPPFKLNLGELTFMGGCLMNLRIKSFKLTYDKNLVEFRSLSSIDSIIIHHTASLADLSAADIDAGHKAIGYACIGYHYLIHKDGSIEKGRFNNMVGAHCYGHNKTSLGIALSGNFEKETMTNEQTSALIDLIATLRVAYPNIKSIQGHCFYNATACPGCNLDKFCKEKNIYK